MIRSARQILSSLVGQDFEVVENQIIALILNTYCWLASFLPQPKRSPPNSSNICVVVRGPGGLDRLQLVDIPGANSVTVGYNVPGFSAPFANADLVVAKHGEGLVIVRNKFFSVNFADIAIRWGLYESALRYVGWPIVPGFDFAGEIEWAHPNTSFKIGERVFGFTLFGAYSSRILVPATQIRHLPSTLSLEKAASLTAVAGTALHAVALSGAYPDPLLTRNRAALIHSAAGGVGSMLIQICKLCGYSPIVGVVGSSHKIETCQLLGADVVIDKSKESLKKTLDRVSPEGYIAVFDANGVETLQDSYHRLSRCGRLIIYGFHTNLPKASHLLSPYQWFIMIYKLINTPKFNPMSPVVDSKAVLGFNLSFFADETKLIHQYMEQVLIWLHEGKLHAPTISVVDMKNICQAHQQIQSGITVGKIVVRVYTGD
mmetsp:Transcript_23136/g.23348  ORF Transcript_23136/g.23348 Transcript_23136/m.23348 type:complete len:430 (-) Transcript_23136:163-1452(-)